MSLAYDPILERLERNVAAVIGLGGSAAHAPGPDRSSLASVSIAAAGFVAALVGLSAGLLHLWPKLATIEPSARGAASSIFTSVPERSAAVPAPVLADLRPLRPEPVSDANEVDGRKASELPVSVPVKRVAALASVAHPGEARSRSAAPAVVRPEIVQIVTSAKPPSLVEPGPEVVVTHPVVVAAPTFAPPPPAAAPAPAMAMSAPPPEPAARIKRRDSVAALMTLRRQW